MIIEHCISIGNLNDWWEKATGEEYVRRAKCIVDQYSARYNEQTGLNLKGKQNQGENIADNGGIKEAYMAYGKNTTFTYICHMKITGYLNMCYFFSSMGV